MKFKLRSSGIVIPDSNICRHKMCCSHYPENAPEKCGFQLVVSIFHHNSHPKLNYLSSGGYVRTDRSIEKHERDNKLVKM